MTTSDAPAQDTRLHVGTITRQLHSALQSLGYDEVLQEVVHEIPDARERLAYVGQMTERAAHKTLSLLEEVRPGCRALTAEAEALISERVLDPIVLRNFVQKTLAHVRSEQSMLDEIMLTQDFQDLSGQVISKVISIITRTENQLVELLVSSVPAATTSSNELAGPQVPDKAMKQDDVDDLLASLGF